MFEAYKSVILIGVALAALSLAAVGGSAVGEWKAQAGFVDERKQLVLEADGLEQDVTRLTADKHALELAIAEQNKAIAVAEEKTNTSNQLAQEAQKRADQAAIVSANRVAEIGAMIKQAKTADEVLTRYWELMKWSE